jgi:hypothetical protein
MGSRALMLLFIGIRLTIMVVTPFMEKEEFLISFFFLIIQNRKNKSSNRQNV